MSCLDVQAVQGLLRGVVGPDSQARIEAHLAGCADCRALVAESAAVLARADTDVGAGGEEMPAGGRVGRYLVKGRLGSGAMGVVYEAEDPELHRRVAIKLLRTGRADRDAGQRLLREAQALARLTHENVVKVYDAGTHAGQVFMALELIEGSDLRTWLAAERRPLADVLAVLVAAGRGLAAAHAAGIVHRDFKPENVLVGTDGRVRVSDFGLARGAGEVGAATPPRADLLEAHLSQSGTIAGTPAYMPPEVLAGESAEARGDQWSYCVTLHEALYGVKPFAGETVAHLWAAVRAGKMTEPPRGAGVPGAVRRVLRRGLALRPEERFAQLDDLLEALTHDATRGARRLLAMAVAALLVGGIALAGDALLRARAMGAARGELTGAASDLERALGLRFDVFGALVRPTSVMPVMREVAGHVDRAEWGLGDGAADRKRLEELHESMASADWSMWTREGLFAVGDYKGRLVYSSGAPLRHGSDLRVVDAVARAYEADAAGVTVTALRGDDEALRVAGLVDAPRPGVVLVLAQSLVAGGAPRAVFVQTIDGGQLLADLGRGAKMRLSMVTHDGSVQGEVPVEVARRAARQPGDVRQVSTWLARAVPILEPDGEAPAGSIVLAQRFDAGLGGLFARARPVLALLGLVLLLLAGAAAVRIYVYSVPSSTKQSSLPQRSVT